MRASGRAPRRGGITGGSISAADGATGSAPDGTRVRHVYTASGGAIDGDVPVVVLVDRNSASASEIVTGALQDRRRAEVVGTRTYGKGVFQEVRELPNGGALDITVGQYFLPSGRNLGGDGGDRGRGIQTDEKDPEDLQTPRRDEMVDAGVDLLAQQLDR